MLTDNSTKSAELHKQAEEIIKNKPQTMSDENENMIGLIHKLQLFKTELEEQNQELRKAEREFNSLYQEYADLYEFAPIGYISLNNKGGIIKINKAGVELLGDEKKILTTSTLGSFILPESEKIYYTAIKAAGETNAIQSCEIKISSRDYSERWIKMDILADCNAKDEVDQWRLTLMDIDEKKKAEESLHEAYSNKDDLFNEFKHRVLNTFSIINGFIDLKSFKVKSKETIAELNEIKVKILAVSQLYSLLNEPESLSSVRLDDYCEKIVSSMMIMNDNIKILYDLDEINYDFNNTVTIGLVIVELIINAIKHAFTPGEVGIIELILKKTNSGIIIVVKDNGTGFAPDVNISGNGSMGFTLIHSLVKKVGGTISIKNDNGTLIEMEFSNNG